MRNSLLLFGFLFLAMISSLAHARDEEEKKLPIPRFVSLKSNETNLRAGPGTRYAINWVYKKSLPVEVIQEFDVWRVVRDSQGTVGWLHKKMLSGKRLAIISKKTRILLREPDEKSGGIVKAEPGVIGQLLECNKNWCRLQIDSRKGWLKKGEFWGAYAKEEFKD